MSYYARARIEKEINELASKERVSSYVHSWGLPQIDQNSYTKFKPKKRDKDTYGIWISAKINACRTCNLCNSKWFITYELVLRLPAIKGWNWEQNPKARILFSNEYEKSSCKRRRESAISTHIARDQRALALNIHYCTICNGWHLIDDVETCNVPAEIERNFQIADHILRNRNGSRDKLSNNRLRFAVWRLYRYHNQTPKAIGKRLRLDEKKVRGIIGTAFKKTALGG
jgi:hypothetical protein